VPIDITLLGIVIEANEVHPYNANGAIVITLLGILIEVNEVHSSTTLSRVVIPLGILIEVNEVPENAPPPRFVTLLGMLIEVNEVQPLKARFSIVVRLTGVEKVIKFNEVQF